MTALHSPAYKSFLKRLKKARIDAGLTQREVSESLGVAQSFISKSESGERRIDIIELNTLARLYKKPISFFMNK